MVVYKVTTGLFKFECLHCSCHRIIPSQLFTFTVLQKASFYHRLTFFVFCSVFCLSSRSDN